MCAGAVASYCACTQFSHYPKWEQHCEKKGYTEFVKTNLERRWVMTDWDTILENVRRATQASEQFKEAGEALIDSQTIGEVETFAAHMGKLHEELDSLLRLLSGGEGTVSDELTDTFTKLFYGKRLSYRRTSKPTPADKE